VHSRKKEWEEWQRHGHNARVEVDRQVEENGMDEEAGQKENGQQEMYQ